MSQQHSYMVITTNFVLEPILDQYLAAYPEQEFQSYSVVFKQENEQTTSYIVVFVLTSPKGKIMRFAEFLDAYCKLNNKVAVASQVNNVFPDFKHAQQQQSHVFGNLKYLKDTTY
jgi:hypothetical protein